MSARADDDPERLADAPDGTAQQRETDRRERVHAAAVRTRGAALRQQAQIDREIARSEHAVETTAPDERGARHRPGSDTDTRVG